MLKHFVALCVVLASSAVFAQQPLRNAPAYSEPTNEHRTYTVRPDYEGQIESAGWWDQYEKNHGPATQRSDIIENPFVKQPRGVKWQYQSNPVEMNEPTSENPLASPGPKITPAAQVTIRDPRRGALVVVNVPAVQYVVLDGNTVYGVYTVSALADVVARRIPNSTVVAATTNRH